MNYVTYQIKKRDSRALSRERKRILTVISLLYNWQRYLHRQSSKGSVKEAAPTNWLDWKTNLLFRWQERKLRLLKMANQLKIESEGNFHTELFYEYDSSSSNSRSGSLEFLMTAKKESFVKEIHFAQALFPEFFVKTAMKGYCTNFMKNSLVCINSMSGQEKKHCKLDSDSIEIWYIKEYGLVAS